MNINRYNYEEFFLLYVDNELTKAERAAVEAFVHDNADLEEELVMLKQSKLRPDAHLKFEGKELLMKTENAGGLISEANYEEFFLLYVDDELDAAKRREVEEFAGRHPKLQQELSLLLQTKVEPEHAVVFPGKALLYKEEKERRPVIVIGWQRIVAVAAVVLLALGIFWISNTGNKQQDPLAKKEQQPGSVKQDKPNLTKTQPAKDQPSIQETDQPQVAIKDKTNKPVNSANRKYNEPVSNEKQLAYEQHKVETVKDPAEEDGRLITSAAIGQAGKIASNNISTALETANVTSAVKIMSQPVAQAVPEVQFDENEDVYIANTTVNRKNKLRGLFRKVTRVFEKTTNLPAAEEKGIRIGSFEIALK